MLWIMTNGGAEQHASNAGGGTGTQPEPHWTVETGGQLMMGGSTSPSTMTSNVQVTLLPRLSWTMQETVFVPTGNGEPDGGVKAMLVMTPGQVLLITGSG